MAKRAVPPEPAGPLEATLVKWGGRVTLHRVHPEGLAPNAFNPTGKGNARFSPIFDSAGKVIPTLYAGSTLDCALMETVFHDVPYAAGFKRISLTVLDHRVHSALKVKRDLVLVDLGTIALHKLGVKRSQLIDTTKAHYPRTRRWAAALYEQFPEAQGLRWTSRRDDQAHAVILFGTRLKASDLAISSAPASLLEDREPILPVIDLAFRLGVKLVDDAQ